MKKWAWLLAIPVLLSFSAPQLSAQNADPGDRMFFPRDMFWGWAQLDLSPPHNEIDPNLCAGNAGQYGGANAPCSMFARYMLSGILEVRPFGRGPLRRFMLFGAPTFLFGKNVPQTLYTWSPDAIGIEHSLGLGIYIGKGFEFRRREIGRSALHEFLVLGFLNLNAALLLEKLDQDAALVGRHVNHNQDRKLELCR